MASAVDIRFLILDALRTGGGALPGCCCPDSFSHLALPNADDDIGGRPVLSFPAADFKSLELRLFIDLGFLELDSNPGEL